MSVKETNPVPSPNSEQRRIAVERYDRANQVIATGDHDYGIQLLLTCCKLDPGNLLYRQTLRRTQKAKFNNNLRGSRFALITTARGRARLKGAKRNQEYLKVLELGEEILSSNPWDLGVQMDMADAADNLGLLDLAIFLLDQARQKYPKDPTLNRALARLFEKRGNFAHAIVLWQLIKEVVPNDVEAAHKAKDLAASETIQRGGYQSNTGTDEHSKLTSSKVEKANPEPPDRVSKEAAPILARLQSNPTDHHLYLQLAGVYKRHHQIDRARAAIEQGLGPTANHHLLLLELMELDLEPLHENLKHTEDRIRSASSQKEIDIDEPSLDELKTIRQKLIKEINNREIEIFRVKADRFSSDQNYRIELGIRLLNGDQVDQAIVELQQARKDPRVAWKATMQLGFCFKKRNNWRLAQRNFEEALSQVPDSEESSKKEILYQLALGHASSGEYSTALDLGHELANIDFAYRDIGQLLDDWQEKLQNA